MSRNSEKAQSMLYRFREQQAAESGFVDVNRVRRPRNVRSVDNLSMCERWRGQVVKEIGQKIVKIQDESLSEYQIRDLNDEINKLMREKLAWEYQIKSLGGPNYIRHGGKVYDDQGNEIPQIVMGGKSNSGYKYFGRARELPDVKELIAQEMKQRKMKQDQLAQSKIDQARFRSLPAEYYGFEEVKGISKYEMILKKEKLYSKQKFLDVLNSQTPEQQKAVETFESIDDELINNIPTQADVEKYLIERLKKTIEDKYNLDN